MKPKAEELQEQGLGSRTHYEGIRAHICPVWSLAGKRWDSLRKSEMASRFLAFPLLHTWLQVLGQMFGFTNWVLWSGDSLALWARYIPSWPHLTNLFPPFPSRVDTFLPLTLGGPWSWVYLRWRSSLTWFSFLVSALTWRRGARVWSWHLGSPGSLAVAPGRAVITITSIIIIVMHSLLLCALKNMQKCECAGQRKTLGVIFKDTIFLPWDRTSFVPRTHHFSETGWPVEPQRLPVSASPELALQARASLTGIFYIGQGDKTRVLLLAKVSSLLVSSPAQEESP